MAGCWGKIMEITWHRRDGTITLSRFPPIVFIGVLPVCTRIDVYVPEVIYSSCLLTKIRADSVQDGAAKTKPKTLNPVFPLEKPTQRICM